jgi:hypothetical protein
MHGNQPIRGRDPGVYRKPTVELRNRDDTAGQWTGPALDPAVDRCMPPWNARGKSPPMRRKHDGDIERPPGDPAQNAGLRRMGCEQVRLERFQRASNLRQCLQVAHRSDRDHEVPQHDYGYSLLAERIDKRSSAAGKNRGGMAVFPSRDRQIPDMDLGTADGLGASHEVRDLHGTVTGRPECRDGGVGKVVLVSNRAQRGFS